MKTYAKVIIIFLVFIIFVIAVFCGAFFLSFKTEYRDIVETNSVQSGVDGALVFAVIKAESKFDANAKSKAGAIGLMQVKLSTANYMLSLNGESEIEENDLLSPEINIKVGTMYLAYLMSKFSDLDVVICAYNAGETAISGWLKNSDYSSDGKTLKAIPYKETDVYLGRVKFNFNVYSKIL